MNWIFYAVATGCFYSGLQLITRNVLRAGKDAWAFSFYFSLVGAIVSLPFMLARPQFPSVLNEPWAYALALVAGGLIVGHNWLEFQARKLLPASVSGTISKLRLVWVMLAGALFLSEPLTSLKLIGTIVTLASGWILVTKFQKPESLRGVLMTVAATMMYSLLTVIVKTVLNQGLFNPASVTFGMIFLVPAVLNYVVIPQAALRIRAMWQEDGKAVVLACVFGALANLTLTQAFQLGEASLVVVIVEAFLVTVLVGEHMWLQEKDHMPTKVVAVILATIGAGLIVL